MLVRVPTYWDAFRCLAGACPHTCCEKWEVVVDEDTAQRYKNEPGALGDKLRTALRQDTDGDWCFPLNGGRCPFLDGDNLCEIHRALGAEATSETCQEHPRFWEDYGAFREGTLSASCPAANALLLGSEQPLTFLERTDEEPSEEGDAWLDGLLLLRERAFALLQDRTLPLTNRLEQIVQLAFDAQSLLDEDCMEETAAFLSAWVPERLDWEPMPMQGVERFLHFLASLDCLEDDWKPLLRRAETAEPAQSSETMLERIAAYFLFRYFLKAVNDGDLLSRVELCVSSVLTVERLASVCGLPEALRRYSVEVEHSEENLDALLEAFRGEEALSYGWLMQTLRERTGRFG